MTIFDQRWRWPERRCLIFPSRGSALPRFSTIISLFTAARACRRSCCSHSTYDTSLISGAFPTQRLLSSADLRRRARACYRAPAWPRQWRIHAAPATDIMLHLPVTQLRNASKALIAAAQASHENHTSENSAPRRVEKYVARPHRLHA